MSLLYWLESVRNPFLDTVMQLITYLGEELLFIVIALVVFWCIDKREGYYLLFVGFFGTILNQFLKLFYRIPRPWVKDPNFTIVESARSEATGYSFPSGHTQNAVGTLGGIARWNRHKGVRILFVILALLVAFSRMYLGVHTPMDVGVSLILGAVLVFAFYPIVRKACQSPKHMWILLGSMILVAFAYVLYANLADFSAVSGEELDNIYHGQKNGYSLLGALAGFAVAYPLERRYVRFSEKAPLAIQAFKLIFGLLGLLAIKEGLKLLFSAVGFDWLGTNAIRYCAVVLYAGFLWPMIFKKLNALCSRRNHT